MSGTEQEIVLVRVSTSCGDGPMVARWLPGALDRPPQGDARHGGDPRAGDFPVRAPRDDPTPPPFMLARVRRGGWMNRPLPAAPSFELSASGSTPSSPVH